jgi:glycosyltransferase involved in cell wall biosynthesis
MEIKISPENCIKQARKFSQDIFIKNIESLFTNLVKAKGGDSLEKIAIIHDAVLTFGGSERVLLNLLEIYPKATVFTTYVNYNDSGVKEHFKDVNFQTSLLQKIPIIFMLGRYFSVFKLYALIYWKSLNLSNYDLVIASSSSYNSKAVSPPTKVPYAVYLHSPPKFLYQEVNELSFIKNAPFSIFLSPMLNLMRKIDLSTVDRPDLIIANSKTVQKRIKRYYRKDSTVVFPPVVFPQTQVKKSLAGKYYLCFSRLVRQKGLDLAIGAFKKLEKPLVIVGEGPESKRLKSLSVKNISFLGYVSDEKLNKIFLDAKALIYCAIDEDFGLVPVEALAHGVPVIAYRSGGVSETVLNGITGILFNSYSVRGLIKAVKSFEKMY